MTEIPPEWTAAPASPVARSAESLVFGLDSDATVLVSARVAAVLMVRAGLHKYERTHRGDDWDVDQALIALRSAACSYLNRMSANGHQVAPITVTQARSAMTTAEAADRLDCSERTVRRMIQSRQLSAQRIGRQWLIDPGDVDRYAAHGTDR